MISLCCHGCSFQFAFSLSPIANLLLHPNGLRERLTHHGFQNGHDAIKLISRDQVRIPAIDLFDALFLMFDALS